MESLPYARELSPGDKFHVVVVGDPGGDDIPQPIREAWLGVEFDAEPEVVGLLDLTTGEPREPAPVWIVDRIEAIDRLRLYGHDEAANWWVAQDMYVEGEVFCFALHSCQPLSGEQIVFPDLN